MFKMNFSELSPLQKRSLKTPQYNRGSNFSLASSGTRQMPSLLLHISNNGKGCGCGKK
jgi:hypothetical protein